MFFYPAFSSVFKQLILSNIFQFYYLKSELLALLILFYVHFPPLLIFIHIFYFFFGFYEIHPFLI